MSVQDLIRLHGSPVQSILTASSRAKRANLA